MVQNFVVCTDRLAATKIRRMKFLASTYYGLSVDVVSPELRREIKNHKIFFQRAGRQLRKILHQQKFPAIWYSLEIRPLPLQHLVLSG